MRPLTTPRAAALAGVLFAALFGTTVFLIRHNMPEEADKDATGWLATQHSGIAIATVLMPFAGISFLWFIGVVRDMLGPLEDRFFATVFLGSGLLFLAMMFVATGVAAALVASKGVIDPAAHTEVIDFGKFVVLAITKTYAIRMAAVFMMSLATIWLKTGLMPRWLVAISYLVALSLLIIGDVSMWVAMAFPAWVLVVSALILARSGLFEQQRARDR